MHLLRQDDRGHDAEEGRVGARAVRPELLRGLVQGQELVVVDDDGGGDEYCQVEEGEEHGDGVDVIDGHERADEFFGHVDEFFGHVDEFFGRVDEFFGGDVDGRGDVVRCDVDDVQCRGFFEQFVG